VSWIIAAESSGASGVQAVAGGFIAAVASLYSGVLGVFAMRRRRQGLETRLLMAEGAMSRLEAIHERYDDIVKVQRAVGAKLEAEQLAPERRELQILSQHLFLAVFHPKGVHRSLAPGQLAFREAKSSVAQRNTCFYSFLVASIGGAATLFYGAALLVLGHTNDAVATMIASAVPDALAALFMRVSTSAGQRAEIALQRIDREVERGNAIDRAMEIAQAIPGLQESRRLQTAAALRAAFPDASAGEIARLLEIVTSVDQ